MFLISNIMELKNAKKKIKMEKESTLFFIYIKNVSKYLRVMKPHCQILTFRINLEIYILRVL